MITKDNAITANNFEHVSLKNKDKSPLRVRRNGKTITWKRKDKEYMFKVPVKYGLYEYTYIDNDNCHLWNVSK